MKKPRNHCFIVSMIAATLIVAEGTGLAADPTTADCLAASDASLKLGNQHKLRAERSQLLVCAASTCPADIRKECLRRVDEVNAQIPTVVFSAKDGTGADLSDVRVTMDGEVLVDQLEGTSLSIDPGEHTFTFETAGQSPVTKKLVIVEGQKDRRELVTFPGPQGTIASVAAKPAVSTTAPAESVPEPPAASSSGLGTQKVLALVAGGIGVVGLGLGTVFGVMALSKKSDAQSTCPNECATQDGVNKWSDATSTANASTIGFIVAGAGLIGGAVLWFTAPSEGSTRPQVGVGPTGLQMRGTW